MNVVIIDDRPKWMKQEEVWMTCFWECPMFKHCASRMGASCKHLGGTEIPKIRG